MKRNFIIYLMFFVFFAPIITFAGPLDTWTDTTIAGIGSLNAVCNCDKGITVVGDSGAVLYSGDYGANWTRVLTRPSTEDLRGIACNEPSGRCVAVGVSIGELDTTVILMSNNGSNWTDVSPGLYYPLTEVIYGNGKYVAVGVGKVMYSTYGSTWTEGAGNSLSGIAYGNTKFVAVDPYNSTGIFKSSDGVAWSTVGVGLYEAFNAVAYGNGKFVAVGSTGNIYYSSDDGANWSSTLAVNWGPLNGVSYGNTTFVAVGDTGTVITSPYGSTWTKRITPITDNLLGVDYGNNIFVAVGETGTILRSAPVQNQLPTVTLTADPVLGTIPLSVDFTADATDTNGSIIKYEWDFDGDGTFDSSTTDSTVVGTFILPGIYQSKVKVTDNDSATAEDITTVTAILSLDTTSPDFSISVVSSDSTYLTRDNRKIKVTTSDDIALMSRKLWIRRNGESDAYDTLILNETGIDILPVEDEVLIPAEYITPGGIKYKGEIKDLAGNVTNSSGFLRVRVADYSVGFPVWTWRMISFPFKLNKNSIDSTLSRLTEPKVYRWNPVDLLYVPKFDTTFDPGDAFWLKVKEDLPNDSAKILVSGISVDTGNVPSVSIPTGWSQVANPYFYEISSSKIKVSQGDEEFYVSDTTQWLIKYDFQTYDYDTTGFGYKALEKIPPFTGVWVKNISNNDVTLIFPELNTEATGMMPQQSPSRKAKNDGWGLRLTVQNDKYIDSNNYLGFLPGAKNGPDFYDQYEPPPVEDHVSLYFPRNDWGKESGRYRTDYRRSGSFGVLETTNYDLTIEAGKGERTALTWDVINPPLNYRLILHDKKENKKIDLADLKDYAIDWSNGDTIRDFSIIVEWDNIYLLNSIEISDLNLNHVIDGEDLSIFGALFGKTHEESSWEPKGDLNKDKIIDGSDLYIIGNNFGKYY